MASKSAMWKNFTKIIRILVDALWLHVYPMYWLQLYLIGVKDAKSSKDNRIRVGGDEGFVGAASPNGGSDRSDSAERDVLAE